MAVPITAPAMPQPCLPPAFAALVGMVRLAASVTTARLAAMVDLMFMIVSLREIGGGPVWPSCLLVGRAQERFRPRFRRSAGRTWAVRKVTAPEKPVKRQRAGKARPFAQIRLSR